MPAIPIAAMGVVALRGTSTRLTGWLGFKKLEWVIVICLSYWLATFFWSGQGFHDLMTYDFFRQDGAMLVSYSALVFFLGWPLKANYVKAFWMIFLTILSLIAIAGTALSLNLPFSGIFDPLRIAGPEPGIGGYMFYGWYHAHNTAGGVYAAAVVLTLALLQEPQLKWKQETFRKMLLLCCFSGLVFTYSRGAWLAFVAGAMVVLPIRKLGKTMRAALLVAVPLGLIAMMSSDVLARIDSIADPYYGTNAARLDLWADALHDFSNSPIVGIGFGRYNDMDERFEGIKGLVWVARKAIVMNTDGHAHNSYLHWMAEGGIIGLLVSVWVWWCAWKELSFFESHFPKSKLYWLEKGAKGCVVVIMVQSLTEHMMGRGSLVLVVGALFGMILATARAEARAARLAAEAVSKLGKPTRTARLVSVA